MNQPETIKIDDVEYVRKDKINNEKKSHDGLRCVIIRTYSAGVHYGYLKERNGMEVTLIDAKRIWCWSGAASLSQLAIDGTSRPSECKIPCAVSEIILTQAIEIIPLTEKAFNSLESVTLWKA